MTLHRITNHDRKEQPRYFTQYQNLALNALKAVSQNVSIWPGEIKIPGCLAIGTLWLTPQENYVLLAGYEQDPQEAGGSQLFLDLAIPLVQREFTKKDEGQSCSIPVNATHIGYVIGSPSVVHFGLFHKAENVDDIPKALSRLSSAFQRECQNPSLVQVTRRCTEAT